MEGMRDFKFVCSLCQHRIQTRTIYAGELIACPVCEGEIVIPEPPPATDSPLPVAYPPGKRPPAAPKPAPASFASGLKPDAYDFAPPPPPPDSSVRPAPVAPPSAASGLEEPRMQEPPPDEPPAGGLPGREDAAPDERDSSPTSGEQGAGSGDLSRAFGTSPMSGPVVGETGDDQVRDVADMPEPADEPRRGDGLEAGEAPPPAARTGDASEAGAEGSSSTLDSLPESAFGPEPEHQPTAEAGSAATSAGVVRPFGPVDHQAPDSAEALPGATAEEASARAAGGASAGEVLAPSTTPAVRVPVEAARPRSASPFAPPAPTESSRTGDERQGPHTGVFILAANALVILIVGVVLLLPKGKEAPEEGGGGPARNRPPAVPAWTPLTPSEPTLAPAAAGQMQTAVAGFVAALGRGDLLGAARWVTPAAALETVTNDLAGISMAFQGSTTNDWQWSAPVHTTNRHYSITIKPREAAGDGEARVGLQEAPVGWRIVSVALTPPSSATNARPVRVSFLAPSTAP